jgi:hypothetical protein
MGRSRAEAHVSTRRSYALPGRLPPRLAPSPSSTVSSLFRPILPRVKPPVPGVLAAPLAASKPIFPPVDSLPHSVPGELVGATRRVKVVRPHAVGVSRRGSSGCAQQMAYVPDELLPLVAMA